MKNSLREEDLAVRLGGDEFVLMLENIEYISQVKTVIDRFYQRLAIPAEFSGHVINISSSMGVSIFPQDGADIHTLLKQADIALYLAKEQGRNRYLFYAGT